jgi:hypothetical protein
VTRWSLPHVTVEWNDQTPKTVSFGRGLSDLA